MMDFNARVKNPKPIKVGYQMKDEMLMLDIGGVSRKWLKW